MKEIELYNDHFQNFKKYLNCKAQLIITDPPYNLGKNAYASNPKWYVDGDNANGESEFANTEQEDKNERLRKIATRLEQLEKEYAEKKVDLESFIRQRSIQIGKKEGLEASKGKENYSFIKTIKI